MTKVIQKTENKKGYKKTKLGWIPEDWDVINIGDLFSNTQSGLSRKLSDYDIGLPVLRSNNVESGMINWNEIKYWYKQDNQGAKTENYYLDNGDILLNFINSIAQIGKCAIFENKLNRDTIFTTNLMRIKLNKKINSKIFLEHTFTDRYKYFIQAIAKPAVNQASFTSYDYKKYLVPLPPIREQDNIAEILSAWDDGIEILEKLIEQKEISKKGAIQRLFFEKSSWQMLRFDKIFEDFCKKNCPKERLLSATQENGVIPRDMLNGKVMSPEGSLEGYKLIEVGDFVISLRSFQGGLEYSKYRGILSPAYTVLKNIIEIDKDFYRHFFKSYKFIEKYLSISVIGIRDGKQISYSDLSSVKIPYPPIEEQKRIGKILNCYDEEIQILNFKLEKLKEQKKGLMQKLLTGQIRVKV